MKEYFLNVLKEKKSYCIIGAIAILIIFAMILIYIFGPKNANNFTGNLMNGGVAVKIDNWTYYLKEDGVYRANSKGNKVENVLQTTAAYLNSNGKFLYFIENNNDEYNLIKMKINGKNKQTMVENIDDKMITVSAGWIYFLQDDNFYKIRTNGKDKIKLLNEDIENYQIDGNDIYYAYKDGVDCVIAKMKTNGTEIIEIENDCNPNFYVKGNKIYYIKEEYNSNKYEYEYTLCEMKKNGNKKEIIKLPSTIKQINMVKDGIYYLITEDYEKYELYKMDYNGKNNSKILETSLNTKINIIDKEIYYMDLLNNTDTALFRINVKDESKQEL